MLSDPTRRSRRPARHPDPRGRADTLHRPRRRRQRVADLRAGVSTETLCAALPRAPWGTATGCARCSTGASRITTSTWSKTAASFSRSRLTRPRSRRVVAGTAARCSQRPLDAVRSRRTLTSLRRAASGLPEIALALGILLATLLSLLTYFFQTASPPRARPEARESAAAKRHRAPLCDRAGAAPERKPDAADHQRGEGLRDFHARRRRTHRKLESRSPGAERIRCRGSDRASLSRYFTRPIANGR